LWVIFALLDPDPIRIRIRIRNPEFYTSPVATLSATAVTVISFDPSVALFLL
jgi:hypothetical protein